MRILIAPDKFKGSLNAREVAENIALGLRDVLHDAQIDIVPMADGGEGTAGVICDALDGCWLKCQAYDPLGRVIDARYAWIENFKLAVMEMSEAAGMRRLSESERDPFLANTFGVGEMILNAAQRSAREIIIGLGGSATNDGGFGMARALGFRECLPADGHHPHPGPALPDEAPKARLVMQPSARRKNQGSGVRPSSNWMKPDLRGSFFHFASRRPMRFSKPGWLWKA